MPQNTRANEEGEIKYNSSINVAVLLIGVGGMAIVLGFVYTSVMWFYQFIVHTGVLHKHNHNHHHILFNHNHQFISIILFRSRDCFATSDCISSSHHEQQRACTCTCNSLRIIRMKIIYFVTQTGICCDSTSTLKGAEPPPTHIFGHGC